MADTHTACVPAQLMQGSLTTVTKEYHIFLHTSTYIFKKMRPKNSFYVLHKNTPRVLLGFVQFDEFPRDLPGTQDYRNKIFKYRNKIFNLLK